MSVCGIMREFTSFAATVTVAVFLLGCTGTGSTPTSLPGKACVTAVNETGVCSPFKACYPYLAAMNGTFMSKILFKEFLKGQSPCEGTPFAAEKVLTTEDLICCPDIVESKYGVIELGAGGETAVAEDDESINGLSGPVDLSGGLRTGVGGKCLSTYIVYPAGNDSEVIPNSYPFMASLQLNGKHHCGGSLIDSRHVLTAAHCYDRIIPFTRMTISLGSHNVAKKESSSITYQAEKVWTHKGFNMRTYPHDIAIIRLKTPVKRSKYIQPICLTAGGTAKDAVVAGWGKNCYGDHCPSSAVLRHVRAPLIANAECQRKYLSAPVQAPPITAGQLCAGQRDRDACQGDSGGPLFRNQGDQYEQIGIVSWGIGCGEYPGVYTRITAYKDWIAKVIRLP